MRKVGTYVVACPRCNKRTNIDGAGDHCTTCGHQITETELTKILIARAEKRRAIDRKRGAKK